MRARLCLPLVNQDGSSTRGSGVDLIVTARMAWLADNFGVVPTCGQDKGDLGWHQVVQLVNRTPGCDVIRNRTHAKK